MKKHIIFEQEEQEKEKITYEFWRLWLKHQQVRAVIKRMPMRLYLHADLNLLGGTVDEVGDEVDADVERHAAVLPGS